MPVFNTEGFGQTVRVNFYRDISAGTAFTIELQPQFGGTRDLLDDNPLTVPAILGTVDIVVDDETMKANQYIEYVTQEGNLDSAGRWRTKGKAVLPAETIVTSYQYFRVDP